MKAIVVERTGGPEVLQFVDRADPELRTGQALIRHEAIGLNFIDVYHRTGLYPIRTPFVPGSEAAGVVEAVAPDVTCVKPGDRVAYVGASGAYAQWNAVDADRLVRLPDEVPMRLAAAVMLKGMTAEFLAERIWPPLKPGQPVLVNAAAGGVGGILVQWLKHRGQYVIAAVGGAAKVATALGHGADEALDYDRQDVIARVAEITGGHGVRVVYDSVGKATFETSLACLGKRGLLVSYGNASGPPPALEPSRLGRLGSLYLTRPTLFDYIASTEDLQAAAAALFRMIISGAVSIEIGQAWPLAEVEMAHRALEGRSTCGPSVLIP